MTGSRIAGNSELNYGKLFGKNMSFLIQRVVVRDFFVGTFDHFAFIDIFAIIVFSLLPIFYVPRVSNSLEPHTTAPYTSYMGTYY